MKQSITFNQAVKSLESAGMKYEVLELGGEWKAIVAHSGGHLLGPFKGDEAQSVLWVNPVVGDPGRFKAFVAEGQWNIGGERLWINPELRFFCESPEQFDSTYQVQGAMDPGHYEMDKKDGKVHLFQHVQLTDLNNGKIKKLSVKRRYASAQNPLKYIKGLKDLDVDYCGYVQDIELQDEMPETQMYLEPWIVTQLEPRGKCVTPFFGDFDFVDYYDPVGDMQRVCDGYAELDITGDRKYKVAYRSANTFGRMAYVKEYQGMWHLMVRNYYNDPSVPYCSEPWGNLGDRGCSIYYYNDAAAGFGEFENGGATIGLDAERDHCSNTTSLWFFFGKKEDIAAIMKTLLGITYKF